MSFTSTYGTNVGTNTEIITLGDIDLSINLVGITTSSTGKYVACIIYDGSSITQPLKTDIYVSSDFGRNFINRTPELNTYRWGGITSSSNGKYVFAYGLSTPFHMSDNYGESFSVIDIAGNFRDATCTYNGERVYVADSTTSSTIFKIYQKSGNLWNNVSKQFVNVYDGDVSFSATPYQEFNVACSGDGKYITLGMIRSSGGSTSDSIIVCSSDGGDTFRKSKIYTTTDEINYTLSSNIDSSSQFYTSNIQMSTNGKYISFIVVGLGNYIFISKDFGETFYQRRSGIPQKPTGLAISYTGQYMALTDNNNANDSRSFYFSNNYGVSWSKTPSTLSNIRKGSLKSSASGQFLAILGGSAKVFTYIRNLYTYSYTPIRISFDNSFNFTFTSTSGGILDSSGVYYLKKLQENMEEQTISTTTIYATPDTSTNLITFTGINTNIFTYGTNTMIIYKQDETGGLDIPISDWMTVNATCFLEGTKILAMDAKFKPKYIPIETLKPGMLVKTLHAGFVPIKYIGYSTIHNPGLTMRVRDQLFICKKSAYPELTEDLVLTGNHSILVDTITDEEREQITETLGGIYVTDRKYRLPAFNDKRAEPYEYQGDFRIWNLALENEDYYENYGIYANGLLVETTSCRYIKELSGMTLVE